MIAIVDYNAGNIKSVMNALQRAGAEFELTADPGHIRAASKVILPGVGNAAEAMKSLSDKGLVEEIKGLRKPVLGICVGMQLMCRSSEEGGVRCMGLFDCDVERFTPEPDIKVPHMGWNAISNLDSKLFKGIEEGSYVYFIHSYRPGLCTDTIATCRHGNTLFSAALKYENFYGTQFHPEKSGAIGGMILKNFIEL